VLDIDNLKGSVDNISVPSDDNAIPVTPTITRVSSQARNYNFIVTA